MLAEGGRSWCDSQWSYVIGSDERSEEEFIAEVRAGVDYRMTAPAGM